MGLYTGLRCKVIIKKEYSEEFDRLMNNYKKTGERLCWNDSNISFLKKFDEDFRADFIPYGALSSAPGEWKIYIDRKEIATDGFGHKFDLKTGYWAFQCSLKNYKDTIENFFKNVLAVVAEKIIHLETYYEEDRYSKSYKLEDEKIILDNSKFVDYKGYDDY
jgi:hypothetical protein